MDDMKNNLRIQKHFFLIIPLIIFLFYGSLPLQAAEFFVDINNAACDNNTADSSVTPYCAIQEAIYNAAPDDTIVIAVGLYNENIIINLSLTLKGASQGTTVVDGGAAGRVFEIIDEINVDISGMKIRNGKTGNGGAGIYNEGAAVTITNVTISDNHEAGSEPGGGIYNQSGTMTLKDCMVIDNSVLDGTGAGIANRGTLTLINTVVSRNTASNGNGGGIENIGGTVTLERSTISDNMSGFQGGGVFNAIDGTLIVEANTVIKENTATNSGGGIANFGSLTSTGGTIRANTTTISGGGLYNSGGSAIAHISGGSIVANTAGTYGGGIHNADSSSTLTLDQTIIISGNHSNTDGGGISNNGTITITNSTVKQNSSGSNGAGIHNSGGGTIVATELTLSANHASESGGGIYHISTGSLTLKSSTLENNTARGTESAAHNSVGRMGPLLAVVHHEMSEPDFLTGGGGGLYNGAGTIATIGKSSITNNSTEADGGAIHNLGGLNLSQNSITGNSARSDGGAIFNISSGTVIATNVTFSGNNANKNGGGVFNGATFTCFNCTIYGNEADQNNDGSGYGGGIHTLGGPSFRIENTLIAGNTGTPDNPDCAGTLNSAGGHNLVQNLTGCTISGDTTGNITGQDPKLDTLEATNGTHALLDGSPAIDTGNPGGCLGENEIPLIEDQIRTTRPSDGNGDGTKVCDIGAVEFSVGAEAEGPVVAEIDEKTGNGGGDGGDGGGDAGDGGGESGGEGGGGGVPKPGTGPFADAPEDPTEDPFTPEDLLAEDPDESGGGCSLARHFNEKQNIVFSFLLLAPLMLLLIRVRSLRCEGRRKVRKKG